MISIIVPIYNAEAYLPACLDSLLAQTVQDLQIILVDDGSTDGSKAIAQTYAAKDMRVELYGQPHAGQSAARNFGLTRAKGQYIAFVDADDTLAADWCERHLQAIEGVDYVQSGYIRVNGDQILNTQLPRHAWQFTSPCMRLYRREALENLRFAEGMIYEDVLFSVDLWLSGATCRIIDCTGYRYTLNPASTTSQRHPEAEKRVLQELYKRLGSLSLFAFRRFAILLYTILRLTLHFTKQ